MSDFISRVDLQKLQHLLKSKLLKMSESPHKDSDLELSESVLKFVDFLVSKQISLADQESRYCLPQGYPIYSATPTTWSTNTSSVDPYLTGRPSTICDNCWQKSGGKHTHCTHAMLIDDGA